MKTLQILTALVGVLAAVLVTLPSHAGDLAENNAVCDANSDVEALVRYEEQMAQRSAQLEAIAILLQADQNEAKLLEQAKVSINAQDNVNPNVDLGLVQKNSVTETVDDTAVSKLPVSDSTTAF